MEWYLTKLNVYLFIDNKVRRSNHIIMGENFEYEYIHIYICVQMTSLPLRVWEYNCYVNKCLLSCLLLRKFFGEFFRIFFYVKLTDVTADTESWTFLNVSAHCSARRSRTACKRRSMRINQCIAMRRKDQNECLFLHSSFFVSCKCLHLVWTEQNARTHTKYNGCGSGGVILFSFSSLFFFSSRIFFYSIPQW